jgi:hypothetical protein
MKLLSPRSALVTALVAMCFPAIAVEQVPPKLAAPTKVRVVVQTCSPKGNERKTIEVEEPIEVKALAAEFEALRANPTGIAVAKYSCSTNVIFFQGARAIEGKRYFTYREGFNHLPALSRISRRQSKEQVCKCRPTLQSRGRHPASRATPLISNVGRHRSKRSCLVLAHLCERQ